MVVQTNEEQFHNTTIKIITSSLNVQVGYPSRTINRAQQILHFSFRDYEISVKMILIYLCRIWAKNKSTMQKEMNDYLLLMGFYFPEKIPIFIIYL